jgi:hypothetical protein
MRITKSNVDILIQMSKNKGRPENLKPFTTDREESLTERLNLRITKTMKEEVQQQEDPPEFCRSAIQEALDKNKQK